MALRSFTRVAGLLVVALATHSTSGAEALRVGAAAEVITPPVGTPMAGYYFERAAEGVHDDLFARALVLEQGGTKAALVSLDLISTPFALVEAARKEIERVAGIPGRNVMISATHAHTGPVLAGRGLRDDALGGGNDLVRRYSAALPGKIAEAVRRADSALASAVARAAKGEERSIAFNRRFHMTDGTVGWNPGKLNPRILKPAGPIDPEVAVVLFESSSKPPKPLATYVNYAVHLDNVGGLKFSADMPGTVYSLLGTVKGPEMVTVYTTGCCGDINHIDVRWAEPQHGFENAARMGIILAGEVLETWPRLKPVAEGPLRVKSRTVRSAPARDLELRRGDRAAGRGPPSRPEGETAELPRDGPGLQGTGRRGEARQAHRGRGPGHRAGQRPGLGLAPRRDLRRARAGDQAGLAVPAHDHRRAGQRVDRLHPHPPGLRPGQLRGRQRPLRRGLRRTAGRRGDPAAQGAACGRPVITEADR